MLEKKKVCSLKARLLLQQIMKDRMNWAMQAFLFYQMFADIKNQNT